MRRDRNHTIAAVVLLAALVAGCSERQVPATPAATLGAPASAQPTTQPPPSIPPTEPVAEDPYAIPSNPKDIDKAYVERVLKHLIRPLAEAVRITVEGGEESEVRMVLSATHSRDALRGTLRALRDVVRGKQGNRVFRSRPRPPELTVKNVLSATRACIFALVRQDATGMTRQKVEPFDAYYHLRATHRGQDVRRNPTPWMIVADAEPLGRGKEYEDPCS
jgi:hypothetical protein